MRGYEDSDESQKNWFNHTAKKNLGSWIILVTVPQTDTGRWAENAKALERTLVKELGKIAP